MEDNEDKTEVSKFIAKKRTELILFFEGINLPQETVDRAIENELQPLKDGKTPYIAASFTGELKSEYEVMTGQPFTTVGEHSHPLTTKEIKQMLKNNPIIEEKARQIQIVTHSDDRKEIAVPMGDVNIAGYAEIQKELELAGDNKEAINKINFKHMQSLATSLNNFEAKQANTKDNVIDKQNSEVSNEEDNEFDAIEKEVSKYTNKSYETRYQETKDMLLKMADNFDNPNSCNKEPIEISSIDDSVLRDSSVHFVKGQRRRTYFEEIKESYAINAAMNIPMKDNPVPPDLSGKVKTESITVAFKTGEDLINVERYPKSFEAKLRDTEKVLLNINTVLNNSSSSLTGVDTVEERNTEKPFPDLNGNQEPHNKTLRFDENMERTLHNALENIYEMINNDNKDNKELEFKEMKNLAQNIVDGAENLSTLIREDITNKLNSMNELLNDANVALENSRKSNIAYREIKEESEHLNLEREVRAAKNVEIINACQDSSDKRISNVSDSQIDDIHTAIGKLNTEIKSHEDRINQSKERYEERNKECKTFMKEVDKILKKSNEILHPVIEPSQNLIKSLDKIDETQSQDNIHEEEKSEEVQKEHWDANSADFTERNKNLTEFKKQELERNKRINSLLYDIKDKMKDNQEVLRLANSLLRREETRKRVHQDNTKVQELPGVEVDSKAQGDHVRSEESVPSFEAKTNDGDGKTEKGKDSKIFIRRSKSWVECLVASKY